LILRGRFNGLSLEHLWRTRAACCAQILPRLQSTTSAESATRRSAARHAAPAFLRA
jgi:hypothetical protein